MFVDLSRNRIFVYWLLGSILISILASAMSISIWQLFWFLEPEHNMNWRPYNRFIGMYTFMYFGWLFSILAPWGWLSIGGLIYSLVKCSRTALIVSLVGALIFGLWWPFWYAAIMGI